MFLDLCLLFLGKGLDPGLECRSRDMLLLSHQKLLTYTEQ